MTTEQKEKHQSTLTKKIDGVVIGIFLSINDDGDPLVAFPGNPLETAIPARSTTSLDKDDVGKEIALLFEGGNPLKPLIIGKIHHADTEQQAQNPEQTSVELDGENIVLSAKQTITLKCGKASITLTKAGKVLICGAYVLNRSSGVNRIKGGSVQIN
jgi:hypothetical protein